MNNNYNVDDYITDDFLAVAANTMAIMLGMDFHEAMRVLPDLIRKARPADGFKVGYPNVRVINEAGLVPADELIAVINDLAPIDLFATLNYIGVLPAKLTDWRNLIKG